MSSIKSMSECLMNKLGYLVGKEIVRRLSKEYSFNEDDALEMLNLEKNVNIEKISETKVKKGGIVLPFCNNISKESCSGIRLNHGLYTQCQNVKTRAINGHMVCLTCEKQILKTSNNEPIYGYIEERMREGIDYRDPKGKSPVNYGNIMDKLNITREEAEKEAAKQNVTIPEEQFEIKKAQRGRPKKDIIAIDTSDSDDETPKKVVTEKKRGRPKKEKEVVSTNTGDDMIKELQKKIEEEENVEQEEEENVEQEEEEEENVVVVKFMWDGKEYLKSGNNTIYDGSSWEELGIWNPITTMIDMIVTSDED